MRVKSCGCGRMYTFAPIFHHEILKGLKIAAVEGHESQAMHRSDRGNLTVDERGGLTCSRKAGALRRMPACRTRIV